MSVMTGSRFKCAAGHTVEVEAPHALCGPPSRGFQGGKEAPFSKEERKSPKKMPTPTNPHEPHTPTHLTVSPYPPCTGLRAASLCLGDKVCAEVIPTPAAADESEEIEPAGRRKPMRAQQHQ